LDLIPGLSDSKACATSHVTSSGRSSQTIKNSSKQKIADMKSFWLLKNQINEKLNSLEE
jgi:hypothetical protein